MSPCCPPTTLLCLDTTSWRDRLWSNTTMEESFVACHIDGVSQRSYICRTHNSGYRIRYGVRYRVNSDFVYSPVFFYRPFVVGRQQQDFQRLDNKFPWSTLISYTNPFFFQTFCCRQATTRFPAAGQQISLETLISYTAPAVLHLEPERRQNGPPLLKLY